MGTMLSQTTRLRLLTQLESVTGILAGMTPEALSRRPPSGKWSAHENLAHLARHHEVFLERLRRILAEDRPLFPRYRAEEDPEWPAWAARTPADVQARLQAFRMEIIGLVEGLSQEELARTGVHAMLGEMTIPLWIEFFLLHEAHHLYAVMSRVRGV